MPPAIDLTGKVFGVLTATRRLRKSADGGWLWESVCECGNICVHSSSQLKRTYSCGCKTQERRIINSGKEPHGMGQTPEFHTWVQMRRRCGHLKRGGEERYAGRGITVCARWRESFTAFLEDMGPRTSNAHTIERIDNDGDYEPGNCRWATKKEQANNRHNTITVSHQGRTQSLAQWCDELGMDRHLVWRRLNEGASPDEAFKSREWQSVPGPDGVLIPIKDCAAILGINRESAYRLHREGKLLDRISRAYSHRP